MTSKDFYKILNEHQEIFAQKSFTKLAPNKYKLDDKNILTFQLDRWGWDAEFGTGFFARLKNPQADEGPVSIFESELDIKPSQLISAGRISKSDLDGVYKGLPKTQERTLLGLYAYYDEKHLSKLLDLVLEPLLDEVTSHRI